MVGRIVPRVRFGDVRWLEETDSTNTRLLEEARAGAPEGRVLAADHQTAGRGRMGRRWEAPPGSALLVSVLVRPALPLGRAHLVTMAAGLAASDACEALAGVRPGLKWPNDLVVDDAKLAGLLAESVVEGDALRALVVGMGLNVTAAPAEGATCLAGAAGRTVERTPGWAASTPASTTSAPSWPTTAPAAPPSAGRSGSSGPTAW
jgi:BirA family biotin operon repressor/biotin-[acetyl-CoA-carboxylase] ligase